MQATDDNINARSIIYPDCWKRSKSVELKQAGFQQFTVNHKYNFADLDFGVNIQMIECLKVSAK